MESLPDNPAEWPELSAEEAGPALDELERLLEYAFRDRALLKAALTHCSSTADKREDNERLEFFGDAILGFLVCEHLFQVHPLRREGELTEIKSAVVRRGALAKAAKALELRSYVILGRGIGGRRNLPASVLADAFEAMIAAIYLDGGLEAARRFILRTLGPAIAEAEVSAQQENYKAMLQHFLQRRCRSVPEYVVIAEIGPDHAKTFEISVRLEGTEQGRGSGASKKEAEQAAARSALAQLDALPAASAFPAP